MSVSTAAMKLLIEIDQSGADLTPWEVKFVADLIDRGVTQFSPKQMAMIQRIYEERVT